MKLAELLAASCQPLSGAAHRLNAEKTTQLLALLPGWEAIGTGTLVKLSKAYDFNDYAETVCFVNAIAEMAKHEDHHPDISFGYKNCRVTYSTHDVGGLSMNDFICAAKVELKVPLENQK